MINIKCCNVACKYNSSICTKNDVGRWDCDDFGYCKYDGEIELAGFKCPDCGDEDDGIACNTFEFK